MTSVWRRRRVAILTIWLTPVAALLGLFFALLLVPFSPSVGDTAPAMLVRNAWVSDFESPEPSLHDVEILDGRIARLAPAGEGALPPGGALLDATERHLVPGLVDLHAHMMRAGYCSGDEGVAWENILQIPMNFDVALRYGNTTLVDLGGPRGGVLAVRGALREGTGRFAPRYLVAGPILTSPGGYPLDWADPDLVKGLDVVVELLDAAHARETVTRLADAGVDLIKIAAMERGYNEKPLPLLTPEVMAAAVEAAHVRHLPVFVHAHGVAGYRLALATGADVIAHSSFEPLPEDVVLEVAATRTLVVPTLWVFAAFEHVLEHPELLEELRPQLMPGIFVALEDFTNRLRASGDDIPPDFQPGLRKSRVAEANAAARDNLLRLYEAGAVIGYGSDTSFCYGLHDSAYRELAEMARAGMPVSAVFAAATAGAREVLSIPDLGRVAIGAPADLLLLKGNPFQSLESLRAPDEVIVGGRLVPKEGPGPPGFFRGLRAVRTLVRGLYF